MRMRTLIAADDSADKISYLTERTNVLNPKLPAYLEVSLILQTSQLSVCFRLWDIGVKYIKPDADDVWFYAKGQGVIF